MLFPEKKVTSYYMNIQYSHVCASGFFFFFFFFPYAYFPSAVDLTLMSLSTLGRISTLVKPGTAHFQAGQGELSINLVRLCPILH